MALREKRAVVWVESTEWTLFNSEGISFIPAMATEPSQATIRRNVLENLSPDTLILVDATEPPIDLQKTSGFIVQATSPNRARWHKWAEQKGAAFFTMPLWTEEEIDHIMYACFNDANVPADPSPSLLALYAYYVTQHSIRPTTLAIR